MIKKIIFIILLAETINAYVDHIRSSPKITKPLIIKIIDARK